MSHPRYNLELAAALAIASGLEVTRLNHSDAVDHKRVYTLELRLEGRVFALQILEFLIPNTPTRGYSAAFIELEAISSAPLEEGASLTLAVAKTSEPLWDEENLTDWVRGVFTKKAKPVKVITDPIDITIMGLYYLVHHLYKDHPTMSNFYCHLRREADTWLQLHSQPLFLED